MATTRGLRQNTLGLNVTPNTVGVLFEPNMVVIYGPTIADIDQRWAQLHGTVTTVNLPTQAVSTGGTTQQRTGRRGRPKGSSTTRHISTAARQRMIAGARKAAQARRNRTAQAQAAGA